MAWSLWPPGPLEFSARLGLRERPQLGPDNEASLAGVHVAGDLAEAPVIKLALRQGEQLARQVWARLGARVGGDPEVLDVLVVGAGPAGIGAALALGELGARYAVLEREQSFQTIRNFPRSKVIFSEPRELGTPGGLWFEDARVDALLARWEEDLGRRALPLELGVELLGLRREAGLLHARVRGRGGERVVVARRVILATGRRGAEARLGVPGEELPWVAHRLDDPAASAGRRVVVVGGGDSAVEAACDCAAAGAQVTLLHRGADLARPKSGNQARLQALVAEGRVTLLLNTTVLGFADGQVRARVQGVERPLPAEQALVLIGARLPTGFLRGLGLRMVGDPNPARVAWVVGFVALTWLFYGLKQKKDFFPFGPGHPLEAVPGLLTMDLGFRTVDASFWGTCLYSLLIVVFGARAWMKYPRPAQRRRYLSLMTFQAVFLFGIPELLAPLIIERPWKVYALTVPWPLSIWSLVDAPSWAGGDTGVALGWLAAGAVVSFGLIPLYVRQRGEAFCSTLCGCGGLAETLGDFWRELAPRGRHAQAAEGAGRLILLAAVPVTLLILNDAWGLVATGALYNTKAFAQQWYGLVVDFGLASVLGVAAYPVLGNRVWCRFFCPLRAYMELLARRFARVAIHADGRCISCGECTRFCQMGIDVQRFAQRTQALHNGNSACIQCGICVEVCPMDVLRLGPRGEVSVHL